MSLPLLFIDDSGDPGVKGHSSSHFVMSAVVFNDDLVAEEVALTFMPVNLDSKADHHDYVAILEKHIVEVRPL